MTHGAISLDALTVLRRGALRLDGWDLGRAPAAAPGCSPVSASDQLSRIGGQARHPSPEALAAFVADERHLVESGAPGSAPSSWSSTSSSSSGEVSYGSCGLDSLASRQGSPTAPGASEAELAPAPARSQEAALHAADAFALGCTLLTLLTTAREPAARSGRASRRVVPPRLPAPGQPPRFVIGGATPGLVAAAHGLGRKSSVGSDSSFDDTPDLTSAPGAGQRRSAAWFPAASLGRGSAVWYLKHLRHVSLECRERLMTSGVSGGGGLLELRGLVTALSHEDPGQRLTPLQLMRDVDAYRRMVSSSMAGKPAAAGGRAGAGGGSVNPSDWPQWRRNAAAAMMAGLDARRGPIAAAWIAQRVREAAAAGPTPAPSGRPSPSSGPETAPRAACSPSVSSGSADRASPSGPPILHVGAPPAPSASSSSSSSSALFGAPPAHPGTPALSWHP